MVVSFVLSLKQFCRASVQAFPGLAEFQSYLCLMSLRSLVSLVSFMAFMAFRQGPQLLNFYQIPPLLVTEKRRECREPLEIRALSDYTSALS